MESRDATLWAAGVNVSERILIALTCGFLLAVGLLALSHRYTMHDHWLYDRLTGEVRYCNDSACTTVQKP